MAMRARATVAMQQLFGKEMRIKYITSWQLGRYRAPAAGGHCLYPSGKIKMARGVA